MKILLWYFAMFVNLMGFMCFGNFAYKEQSFMWAVFAAITFIGAITAICYISSEIRKENE